MPKHEIHKCKMNIYIYISLDIYKQTTKLFQFTNQIIWIVWK